MTYAIYILMVTRLEKSINGNIRPVVRLKSGVKVTHGDGSEENPYILTP